MGRDRATDASDADLVEAATRGERAALEELLARHFDLVHAICRRILWRPYHADALEQARQDALLRIARGISRFNAEAQLWSWIHRIATNAALDALKRYDRTPVPSEVPERMATGSSADTSVPLRLRIDECLDRLPEVYRRPIVLCFLCDLDYDEIANDLDLPVGTVKSRIHRGRASLRHCLGDEGDVEPAGTGAGVARSNVVVDGRASADR